jgi:hypothetical protein
MTWYVRALQCYAIGTTALLGVVAFTAFGGHARTFTLDALTVGHLNVVDSTGRVRVEIGGSFPPRRTNDAGILFVDNDGIEAGGLTYRGRRDADGHVIAGGILTMDQYNSDQVVALNYAQTGLIKREGLTISDRPDTMGPALAMVYQVLDTFPPGPRRDSVQRALLARVPAEQRAARRVFVGRDTARAAVLLLSDRMGAPRLQLAVDSLGRASIVFLDAQGKPTRTIRGY